jgi:hypothetical protein
MCRAVGWCATAGCSSISSSRCALRKLPDNPKQARLRVGYTDAIYGRSRGDITPSGWRCEHLPYLVEFDNYGRKPPSRRSRQNRFWVWGWMKSRGSRNSRRTRATISCATRGTGCAGTTLRATCKCPECASYPGRRWQTLRCEPVQRRNSKRLRPGTNRSHIWAADTNSAAVKR